MDKACCSADEHAAVRHSLKGMHALRAEVVGGPERFEAALLQAVYAVHGRAHQQMTEIAKASGMTREALYKALRADAHPRFETISRVCAALGVKLVAQVAHAS